MERVSTATDNIYRRRELVFYLNDGCVISSKDANFSTIPLNKISMLELIVRDRAYRIRKSDLPPSFVEFVHFRTTGFDYKVDERSTLYETVPMNSWSIGWSDGRTEHLIEVDFQTGFVLRDYTQPVAKSSPSHFHPQSKVYERNM